MMYDDIVVVGVGLSIVQACRFALILATHAKYFSGKLSFRQKSLSLLRNFLEFVEISWILGRIHLCGVTVAS